MNGSQRSAILELLNQRFQQGSIRTPQDAIRIVLENSHPIAVWCAAACAYEAWKKTEDPSDKIPSAFTEVRQWVEGRLSASRAADHSVKAHDIALEYLYEASNRCATEECYRRSHDRAAAWEALSLAVLSIIQPFASVASVASSTRSESDLTSDLPTYDEAYAVIADAIRAFPSR